MVRTVGSGLEQRMEQCIEACLACRRVCVETTTHCLQAGGRHAEAEHIRLLQDCVQICGTSADFMLRGSPLHGATCRACAEVCRACATECARFEDDETMLGCAKACGECAESCEDMAGTGR